MKILFVGEVGSIHVARWINQLYGSGWDYRIFQSVPYHAGIRNEYNPAFFYLPYEILIPESFEVKFTLTSKPENRISRLFGKIFKKINMPFLTSRNNNPEIQHARFLANLIRDWQPDVIHSLGMFCNWRDNGIVVLRARDMLEGGKLPCPWIVSSWGADLDLYPYLGPKEWAEAEAILSSCDNLIIEGERDINLAKKLGFHGEVLAKLPAYGGITWKTQDYCPPGLPSQRRIVLLKGRDNTDHVSAGGDPQGRAMTALKAFKICRDVLSFYPIVIVQATPAIEKAAKALVAEGMDITIHPNSVSLPYNEWLNLLGSARILIAVTASDGLPSTLIEAMSLGVFPIHSGLETVREWLTDGENGFLVPFEDPEAVAHALRTALEDDAFVDKVAERNLEIIAGNLSDTIVRPKVINLYKNMITNDRIKKEFSKNHKYGS